MLDLTFINYLRNFLKNGGTPDTSKLYNVLHEKASEINKRFVDELHSYVHSNGKLTICGECLPKLTKANYDIMVMCECCHFHTFYTTLFNKNEKGQERFKVYRINFQLASCGFGDSLAYVDGEYIPLSQVAICELHNYTNAARRALSSRSISSRHRTPDIYEAIYNDTRHVSMENITKENYKIGVNVYTPYKGKHKVVNVTLSRYADSNFIAEYWEVPVFTRILPGDNWK